MTCKQGPCDVPAHLATHDCFDRPLSGWEVRSVLGVVLPLLILATPRNRKRGLVVLPKGDMSPYLMMQVAHVFSACMPLTVLVEDEALALRTLDEEEESPVIRKYPVQFVCESRHHRPRPRGHERVPLPKVPRAQGRAPHWVRRRRAQWLLREVQEALSALRGQAAWSDLPAVRRARGQASRCTETRMGLRYLGPTCRHLLPLVREA